MITPRQLRAARAILGWNRSRLADASGVPEPTIQKFEAGKTTPLLTTAGRLRRTMERAGVVFIDPDRHGGPGVRLRENEEK